MAIVTLEGGWAEGLLKHHVEANFTDLVAQDAGGSALLAAGAIKSVIGKAQTEFQAVCNANMAVLNASYTTTYTTLKPGDSWGTMRDVMNANFTAFDATINPT